MLVCSYSCFSKWLELGGGFFRELSGDLIQQAGQRFAGCHLPFLSFADDQIVDLGGVVLRIVFDCRFHSEMPLLWATREIKHFFGN